MLKCLCALLALFVIAPVSGQIVPVTPPAAPDSVYWSGSILDADSIKDTYGKVWSGYSLRGPTYNTQPLGYISTDEEYKNNCWVIASDQRVSGKKSYGFVYGAICFVITHLLHIKGNIPDGFGERVNDKQVVLLALTGYHMWTLWSDERLRPVWSQLYSGGKIVLQTDSLVDTLHFRDATVVPGAMEDGLDNYGPYLRGP